MSKRYIKEMLSGGIEITVFTQVPADIGDRIEVDESELEGKNPDKCRINVQGKVYEDPTIITKKELDEQLKNKTKVKLKALGFTYEEIISFIK